MSIDSEIIFNRLEKLKECLGKLKPISDLSLKDFQNDTISQDVVERNLQIVIHACLDIGTHIISALSLERSQEYKDVFAIPGREGIIPDDFASKNVPMASLRNLLVRGYHKLDMRKIYENLQN